MTRDDKAAAGTRGRPGLHRHRRSARSAQTLGEAVFSTGMSGYQETLTDPSYHRQIVVATAPQIGNTGWNDEDGESRGDKIWVAGYAVRDPSPRASNWRATGTLDDELVRQGIVGIAGIDTRAVVRHLRSRGSMKAGVFSGDAADAPVDELLAGCATRRRCSAPTWPARSAPTPATWWNPKGQQRFTVAALDLGIKTNTPRNFAQRGIRSHVLPSSATFEQIADAQARRGVPVQRAGRPGHRRPRRRRDPRGARRRNPAVRHLLRQPDPRPGAGPVDLQDDVRPPRHQHPGDRPRHRPGRDHRAEPRLRARRRGRRGVRHAVRPGRSSATPAPTTVWSKASGWSTAGRSRCSTTRRRPRARTTPNTCSTSSST